MTPAIHLPLLLLLLLSQIMHGALGFSTTHNKISFRRRPGILLSSSSSFYDEDVVEGNDSDDDSDDDYFSWSSRKKKSSNDEDDNSTLQPPPPCIIQCIGVGGGGGNAINHMIQNNLQGVNFVAVNTDAQALSVSLAPRKVNIGRQFTRGLGAGGDPQTGAKAALESVQELENLCKNSDLVFLTAGMGGGTGSGATPVLAEIARQDCGCLTVAVVTKPFAFEGKRRMRQADEAIEKLRQNVDTLIVVSNDKLLQIVPDNTPIMDAFLVADDILRQGVLGITDIIVRPGLVNVDFADVKTVMKDAGLALIGMGTGTGKNRATDAALAAISSPLLDFPIHKAKRVVFNIVGGNDLGLAEINAASEVIYENCDDDANIIFGALVDPELQDEVSITVLACDFEEGNQEINNKRNLSSLSRAGSLSSKQQQHEDGIQSQQTSSPNDFVSDHQTSVATPPPTTVVKRGFTRPPNSKDTDGSKKSKVGRLFKKIRGD